MSILEDFRRSKRVGNKLYHRSPFRYWQIDEFEEYAIGKWLFKKLYIQCSNCDRGEAIGIPRKDENGVYYQYYCPYCQKETVEVAPIRPVPFTKNKFRYDNFKFEID